MLLFPQFTCCRFSQVARNLMSRTVKRLNSLLSYIIHFRMLPLWASVTDKQSFVVTPKKTNIAPENMPSQKETHLPTTIFQGRAVSFRGCTCPIVATKFPLWTQQKGQFCALTKGSESVGCSSAGFGRIQQGRFTESLGCQPGCQVATCFQARGVMRRVRGVFYRSLGTITISNQQMHRCSP